MSGVMAEMEFQGLRLRSEFPITGAHPPGEAGGSADLQLRLSQVPKTLAEPRLRNRFLQVGADGSVLVHLPGTGRFLVKPDGRSVFVDPSPDGDLDGLRDVLSGSVLGVVSYRMGRVALHGSSVLLEGGAVAFAGPPGAGKSTLAGAFRQAGVPVLGDDLLPVEVAGSLLSAYLAPGGLRLMPDAVETLALGEDEGLHPVRGGKWGIPLPQPPSEPCTLRSIYLLNRRGSGPASIEALQGPSAVVALTRALYRRRVAWALLGEAEVLARLASMAERADVYRLRYPSTPEGLRGAVAAVREHEGGGAQ